MIFVKTLKEMTFFVFVFKRMDEILTKTGFKSQCIEDNFSCGNEADCRCYLAQVIFRRESRSCKKYLSFTQSKVGQKILWIWICPKINVYFQGALPKEPSSLVGFPRLNQKLCRTKLSWLLHGKRMVPPTFSIFDCPFMPLHTFD